jgi:hypothetical protein
VVNEVRLAGEVVVDRLDVHVGPLRDVGDRDRVKTALEEQL